VVIIKSECLVNIISKFMKNDNIFNVLNPIMHACLDFNSKTKLIPLYIVHVDPFNYYDGTKNNNTYNCYSVT